MSASTLDLPEVTVPLLATVQSKYRHYFDSNSGRAPFRNRRYEFGAGPLQMPLVRAFLNACAERQDPDYQDLFTLLGSELAANAIRHTRSGERFGYYTLTCMRLRDELRLLCKDQGVNTPTPSTPDNPRYLTADPNGLDANVNAGRGLAMINALASEWGDNGLTQNRQVWFHLPYDLSDNPWSYF
ncbi:ATP-binding protein [Nocardiopsis exhalans]|uniref:ATP-binding protein n=1 Tax=Nocardiopsis exhalans TaxID=163604 RepID=A0ABY5D9U0_9ACTN|nr:ATP-binding protein [Nocardiopsis exhalans]USY20496.1 ATP-binding protein [Nocardiopsis exhalans]